MLEIGLVVPFPAVGITGMRPARLAAKIGKFRPHPSGVHARGGTGGGNRYNRRVWKHIAKGGIEFRRGTSSL